MRTNEKNSKPEITVVKTIDAEDVQGVCIENGLYCFGDTKDYEAMLVKADMAEYSVDTIYDLAKDIKEHSEDGWTVVDIMGLLERDAVNTVFQVSE